MFRRVVILISILIISDAYCNVIIKTSSLSVPRNTMSSIQVGRKAYFVGGFTYDSVGSDVIDVLDLTTNQWNGKITIENSTRAAVTTVSNGTHLYLIGGYDYVNQPYLYNTAKHAMVQMMKSGPTVRDVSGLAIWINWYSYWKTHCQLDQID